MLRASSVLQGDLARHLRAAGWLTFTEISVPGTESGGWAPGRVDVVAVKSHVYANRDLRAYECKENRADFQRDVGADKWRRYLRVFPRVYFAVPSGLVKKSEVPDEAGLIVRGPNGWTTVKAAKGHIPPELCVDSILALLYRGYEQDREVRNIRDRMIFNDQGVIREAKAFGWDTRRKLNMTAHELDPTLRTLMESLETLIGEPVTGLTAEDFARKLKAAAILADEAEKHGEALRHIGNYLHQLTASYSSEDSRERARQEVEEI
jgi:hypothetical protein